MTTRINPLNSLLQGPPQPQPHYRWGYVTSLLPLQVVLDTETQPIYEPSTLIEVGVGDRVFVLLENRRATVLGKVPVPPPSDDTGWVALSPGSGFTFSGDVGVRRVGQVVNLRGTVERTAGGISDSSAHTCTTLPPEFRPSQVLRVPAGMHATSTAYALPGLYINTGGAIQCVRIGGSGSTHASFHLGHTWLVD